MTLRERLFAPPRRLMGMGFLMDFQVSMVGLAIQCLGVYLLGAPPVVLGLFGTLAAGVYTIGCLLSGSISDRFGRRRCILAACVGAGIAWTLLPGVGHWRWVLVIVPLSGASLSLFWPSVQAWLAELTTGGRRELARNLGLFNVLWCSGLMLGPVVTGYLWDVNHSLTFHIPAALLVAIVALTFTTPRGFSRPGAAPADDVAGHENVNLFLKLAWVGNFASWFAAATVGAMFPKLGDSLGFPAHHVGWLLFSLRAGQVLMFIYTRYEHRWQYRLWPMAAAQGAAALAMALAAVATGKPAFAAAFAVVGLCGGITYVGSLFYALHGRLHGRGKTSGFHEAVLGAGAWLGPLLGGIAAQFISLHSPFAVAAFVFALACLIQLAMVAPRRPGAPDRAALPSDA